MSYVDGAFSGRRSKHAALAALSAVAVLSFARGFFGTYQPGHGSGGDVSPVSGAAPAAAAPAETPRATPSPSLQAPAPDERRAETLRSPPGDDAAPVQPEPAQMVEEAAAAEAAPVDAAGVVRDGEPTPAVSHEGASVPDKAPDPAPAPSEGAP